MKKITLMMLFPLLLMVALLWLKPKQLLIPVAASPNTTASPAHATTTKATPSRSNSTTAAGTVAKAAAGKSDEIVAYAMSLLGSPYVYAGITAEGFDCSGFVTHVFGHYGVDVPHSSALQADEGVQVARKEAQPGDLVIFTGTNPDIREPGHVGIVISTPGKPIRFVHASSNGGVKVSKVAGTRYNLRFLQIRRVL